MRFRFSLSLLSAALIGMSFAPQAKAQNVDYGALGQMFGQPVTTSATGSPELASQAPADFLFLTAGLGAEAAKGGAQANTAKILCITNDLSATQAGNCAVAVQTTNGVHITVNKAAAAASGISFAAAFMLMITEI